MLSKKNKTHAHHNKKNIVKKKDLAKAQGFISLTEAAGLCSYSQEYISLLVRKKLLQGEKIGRNWFTKKEWLEKYILEHPAEKKGNTKGELRVEKVFKERIVEIPINKNLKSLRQDFSVWLKNFFIVQKNIVKNNLLYNVSNIKYIKNYIYSKNNNKKNVDKNIFVGSDEISVFARMTTGRLFQRVIISTVIFSLLLTTASAQFFATDISKLGETMESVAEKNNEQILNGLNLVKEKIEVDGVLERFATASENFSATAEYKIKKIAGDDKKENALESLNQDDSRQSLEPRIFDNFKSTTGQVAGVEDIKNNNTDVNDLMGNDGRTGFKPVPTEQNSGTIDESILSQAKNITEKISESVTGFVEKILNGKKEMAKGKNGTEENIANGLVNNDGIPALPALIQGEAGGNDKKGGLVDDGIKILSDKNILKKTSFNFLGLPKNSDQIFGGIVLGVNDFKQNSEQKFLNLLANLQVVTSKKLLAKNSSTESAVEKFARVFFKSSKKTSDFVYDNIFTPIAKLGNMLGGSIITVAKNVGVKIGIYQTDWLERELQNQDTLVWLIKRDRESSVNNFYDANFYNLNGSEKQVIVLKGEKGETGERGEKGETGEAGANGLPGKDGSGIGGNTSVTNIYQVGTPGSTASQGAGTVLDVKYLGAGNLSVSDKTTLNTLTVTGVADFNNAVNIAGNLTLSGATASGGNFTTSGNILGGGYLKIGNGTPDWTLGNGSGYFTSNIETDGSLRIDSTTTTDPYLWLTSNPVASAENSALLFGSKLVNGSSVGTLIGSNVSDFSGDFLNFQVNDVSKFKIDSGGNISSVGWATHSGSMTVESTTTPQLTIGYDSNHVWNSAVDNKGNIFFSLTSATNTPEFTFVNPVNISLATETNVDVFNLTASTTAGVLKIVASSTEPLITLNQTGAGGGIIFLNNVQNDSTAALIQYTDNPLNFGAANGTFIAANPNIFSGNWLDFQIAGTRYFSLASDGDIFSAGGLLINTNSSTALSVQDALGNTHFVIDTISGKYGFATSTPNRDYGLTIATSTLQYGDWRLIGNATTTGTLTGGALSIGGDVTLGDSGTDRIVFNGYVLSDIIPADNARSLGSSVNRWNYGYFDSINVNELNAGGTNISGTASNEIVINSSNVSDDTEDASVVFERGTPVTNAAVRWDASENNINFNFPIWVEGTDTTGKASSTITVKAGINQGDCNLFQIKDVDGNNLVQADPVGHFAVGGDYQDGYGVTIATSTYFVGDAVFANGSTFNSITTTDSAYLGGNLTVIGDTFLNGGLRINTINSTTTNIDNLTVNTGATINAATLNGLTTIADARVTSFNATTTKVDNLTVNSSITLPAGALSYTSLNWYWATSSEEYFWNNTSTWSGFESEWNKYTNASSTLITLNDIDTSLKIGDIVTDETGSGSLVFAFSPTISGATLNNLTTIADARVAVLNATSSLIDNLTVNTASILNGLTTISDGRIAVLNATSSTIDNLTVNTSSILNGLTTITDGRIAVLNATTTSIDNLTVNTGATINAATLNGLSTISDARITVLNATTTSIDNLTVNTAVNLPAGSISANDLALTQGYILTGNASNYAEATSSIFVAENGYVGIGTASPGAKLEVYHSDAFSTVSQKGSGNDSIFLSRNVASSQGTYFGSIGFGDGLPDVNYNRLAAIAAVQSGADEDQFGLAFLTHPLTAGSGAISEAVRITHDGYLGIATTTPYAKLTVIGDDYNLPKFMVASSTGASTPSLYVASNGNVGVGTNSPGYNLDVVGNVNISDYLKVGNTSYGIYLVDNVPITLGNGSDFSFGYLSATDKSYWSVGTTLGVASGITMDTSGNVGIGTSTPSYRLTVQTPGHTADTYGFAIFDDLGEELLSLDDAGNLAIGGWSGSDGVFYSGQYINKGAGSASSPAITWSADTNTGIWKGSGNADQLMFGTGGLERLRIESSGNVGIANSNPQYKLDVAGSLNLNSTSTAYLQGHVVIGSNALQDGYGLTVATSTYIGGHCVTGDTLLPILEYSSNNSNNNSRDIGINSSSIREVRIDDIKGGEMVLSLNEKTGLLEPARIKGLMDMGVKPIYKITTESGKTIRTTGNHPYLTRANAGQVNLVADIFSSINVNNSNQIFSFDNIKNSHVVQSDMQTVANGVAAKFFNITMLKRMSQQTHAFYFTDNFISHDFVKSSQIFNCLVSNFVGEHNRNYEEIKNSFSTSADLTQSSLASAEEIMASYFACAAGDSNSLTQLLNSSLPMAKVATNCFKAAVNSSVLGSKTPTTDLSLMNNGWVSKCIDLLVNFNSHNYSKKDNDLSNSEWTKVAELFSGDEIAVADKTMAGTHFEKIVSIEILPAEQVYDIEVEGTHNFVANGIIAHNTYLGSSATTTDTHHITQLEVNDDYITDLTGTGLTITDGALSVTGLALQGSSGAWETAWANTLTPTSTTAGIFVNASSTFNSTLGVNGNFTVGTGATTTIGNNALVVRGGDGNVGIGTASPSGKMQITKSVVPSAITKDNSYLVIGGPEETLRGYHLISFGYNMQGSIYSPAYIGYTEQNNGSQSYGDLIFGTRNVTSDTLPSERMRITGAGAIGIATTTPGGYYGEKLTVVGGAYITGGATTTALRVLSLNVGGDDITDITGTGLAVVDGALSVQGFALSGANGAWENIWTNTLTPTSTTAGIFVNASSTFNSTLGVNGNFTVASGATTTIGNNALVVRGGDGNVGIGTVAPEAKLHIVENSARDNFIIERQTSFPGKYAFNIAGGKFNFRDVTNGQNIFNTSYANVGGLGSLPVLSIGAYEPSNDSVGSPGLLKARGAGSTGIDTPGGDLYIASGTGRGNGTQSEIKFFTPDMVGSGSVEQTYSTKMIVKGSGNVGIATTTPYAKLSVVSDDYNLPKFMVASSTGFSTPSLYVASNGNVGIGKNNPTYPLDVTGNSNVTGYGLFGGATIVGNGSHGMYYSTYAAGKYGFGTLTSGSAYPLNLSSGSNSSTYSGGYISLSTNGTEAMRIASSSAIGIATTTPGGYYGEKLTVAGGAYITGGATTTALRVASLNVNGDDISDITGTGLTITNGALSVTGMALQGNSGAWENIWTNTLTPTSTTAGIFVNASSTFNSTLGVNGNFTVASGATTTIGNNALVVRGGDGRVGIGTNNPRAPLEINNKSTSGYVDTLKLSALGAINGQDITMTNSYNRNLRIRQYNNNGTTGSLTGSAFFQENGGALSFFTNTAYPIFFATNNKYVTPHMTISSDGNIGIATTSPVGLLDVGGRLVVTHDGQIGIANTNPQYTLDLAGSMNLNATSTAYFNGKIAVNTTPADLYGVTIATTTTFSALTNVSDLRVATLNATSTNVGTLNAYGLATLADSRIAVLNATSTVTDSLKIGSDETITDITGTGLTISGGALTVTGLALQGAPGAWENIWTNTLTPTSTGAGIFVTGSSTIDNNLRVAGRFSVATGTPWDLTGVVLATSTRIVSDQFEQPKFVVGSSTATSLVVNNKGYVGIGTTDPGNFILNVNGMTYLGSTVNMGSGNFNFYSAGGRMTLYDGRILGFGGTGGTPDVSIGYVSATDKLVIAKGTDLTSTPRFVLDTDGNIGIATTTPGGYYGEKLTVAGGVYITGGATTTALRVSSLNVNGDDISDITGTGLTISNGALSVTGMALQGNSGAWENIWTNTLTPTSTTAGIFVNASSTFNSTLRINGALTVNANATTTGNTTLASTLYVKDGNVGIGTPSPGEKLTLLSSGSDAMSISYQSITSRFIFSTNWNATTADYLGIRNSNEANPQFVFGRNGQFGIATTTPGGYYGEKLTVVGGAYITGGATTTALRVSSLNVGGDDISDITGTGLTITNGALSVTGMALQGTSGAWENIWTNTLTPTSTTAGIFVRASSTFDSTLRVNGDFTVASGATTTIGNNALVVRGGDGRVGIGTAAPAYKLDIRGGSMLLEGDINILSGSDVRGFAKYSSNTWNIAYGNANSLTMGESDQGYIVMGETTGGYINLYTNSASRFYINSSGSVGIATSTPGGTYGEKLTVVGGAYITDGATTTALRVSSLNVNGDDITDITGTGLAVVDGALSVQGFALSGSNGAWENIWTNTLTPTSTTAGIFVNASSTFNSTLGVNGNFTVASGATTTIGNNALVVRGGDGNVGVGTESPTDRLVVAGGIVSSSYASSGNSFSSNGNDVYIQTGAVSKNIYLRPNGFNGTTGQYIFSTTGFTSSGTGNSSIAGNLGIANTNPQYKLDIAGSLNLNATSTLFANGKILVNTTTPFGIDIAQGYGATIATSTIITGTTTIGANNTMVVNTNESKVKIGNSLSSYGLNTLDVAGNFNFDQVTDPTAAQIGAMTLTENAGGGTLAAGLYYYNVAFVTAEGDSSTYDGASIPSITIALNSSVTLNNIPTSPDPRVTSRKIYRTDVNPTYRNFAYRIATIADNTTTSFTDTGYAQVLTDYSYWKSNTTAGVLKQNGTIFGQSSLYTTSFGYGAVDHQTTGLANAGFGVYALTAVTSGSGNVGVGYSAGTSITTGFANIGVGYATLQGNQTGSYNIGIGQNTLRNEGLYSFRGNVGIGDSVFRGLYTNSDYNVAIGFQAGYSTGFTTNATVNNTMLGAYPTRPQLTTGDNNLFLGYGTGKNITSGSNNILIGYDINAPSATASNQLSIGNLIYGTNVNGTATTTAAGNIGIATSTPFAKLSVVSDDYNLPKFMVASSTGFSTPSLYVASNGRVGIGTNNPVTALQVTGSGDFSASVATPLITPRSTGSDLIIKTTGAKDIIFVTNNTQEKMRLTSAGNVGIGTDNPNSKLEIYNSAGAGTITMSGNGSDAYNFDSMTMYDTGGKYWAIHHRNTDGGLNNLLFEHYNGSTYNGYMTINPDGHILAPNLRAASLNASSTLISTLNFTNATGTNLHLTELCLTNDCKTAWPTGGTSGSAGSWENIWTNTLTPTSTTAGIFVNASSTFNSTLRVNNTLTIAPAAGNNGLVVQAASGATANLLQLTNSSSSFLSGFTAAGGLLMNISSSTAIALQNGSGSAVLTVPSNSATATTTLNTGLNVDSGTLVVNANENRVGIGTAKPGVLLDVRDSNNPTSATVLFQVSTSTNVDTAPNIKFKILADGGYYSDGALRSGHADYAEYFKTKDMDLYSGETVCIDVTNNEAVVRCTRGADDNVIGIISTNPSVIGNAPDDEERGNDYALVALLGQIPALVSVENGEIRPGDSLTSASSTPGYLMKANAGDATVGIALQSLSTDKGTIQVLISRRNKSLSVEQVEEQVTKRVADMEIEDEVNIMISEAMKLLGVEDQIKVLGEQLTELNDQNISLLDRLITLENASTDGENNKFEEIVLGNNNLEATSTEISIKVKQLETGELNLSVNTGAEFVGDVVVQNLEVKGKIVVYGRAEFLGDVSLKANLELEGAVIQKFYEKSGETLNFGDAVYISGDNEVSRGYADDAQFRAAIGIVVGFELVETDTDLMQTNIEEIEPAIDDNVRIVKVAIGGAVKGFKNLLPGERYYLADLMYYINNTDGMATTTDGYAPASLMINPPSGENSVAQVMAIAKSRNELLIMPMVGYTNSISNIYSNHEYSGLEYNIIDETDNGGVVAGDNTNNINMVEDNNLNRENTSVEENLIEVDNADEIINEADGINENSEETPPAVSSEEVLAPITDSESITVSQAPVVSGEVVVE